ncbi:MAG: twitching motility protein PilT [Candidatus Paceibacteria bacterium]|jgi:twitching motility protein PilT
MAWIDSLFQRMGDLDASDLHMTSSRKPMFRLHGDMVEIEDCADLQPDQMRQILYEIIPDRNREQFEECGDTDFAYELPGVARFRCNYFMDHRGPAAVFRLIPSEILTAEKLGLPQPVLDLCFLSKGLVVVTGPTGSGKSTTLAAMVDHLNKNRSDHVITIEDPIEFLHPDHRCLINQREVGRHTDGFKTALRAALREDPDIILVGEMRDLETIEIAIETAETGHLVFGTLHTTTAASTVDRIIDQFPADRQSQIRTMLASSLKGVIAQTLCKKIGGGRKAALEVMLVNSAISSQIREGKTHQIVNAMQTGGKIGMQLMNDALMALVSSGDVEPGEAYIKAVDKSGLMAAFANAGINFNPSDLSSGSAPSMDGAAAVATTAAAPATPAPAAPLPTEEPDALGEEKSADPFAAFKKRRG